jgi:signal-transduction protein with cAMP-binding, CBS, and nucleotidyltransferase domain
LLEGRSDHFGAPNRKAHHDGAALALTKATAGSPWGRLLVTRLIEGEGSGDRSWGDEAMLDLILFLKTTPLFRSVPLEDIARVARLAEPVSKDQGETIADAQDPVRHVYVVRNGAIELRLNDMAVEIAGPGASIGECAVFGEERHAVTFRAASPSLLLRFPISIIADLVAENPEVLGPLALDLSARLNRLRARLAAQPM